MSAATLAACNASPLPDPSGVAVVSAFEVASCTPVTILTTTIGVSGTLGREKALELARDSTLEELRKRGADTAVITNGAPGSDDLFVRAEGYDC